MSDSITRTREGFESRPIMSIASRKGALLSGFRGYGRFDVVYVLSRARAVKQGEEKTEWLSRRTPNREQLAKDVEPRPLLASGREDGYGHDAHSEQNRRIRRVTRCTRPGTINRAEREATRRCARLPLVAAGVAPRLGFESPALRRLARSGLWHRPLAGVSSSVGGSRARGRTLAAVNGPLRRVVAVSGVRESSH